MVVVDCHVHLLGRGYGKGLPPIGAQELLGFMDRLGVDRAVVFAAQAPNFPAVNDLINKELKKTIGRLIGFVRVNPYDGEVALADIRKRVREQGWKGLKLHPVLQGFPIVSEVASPILEEASRLRIPVLIHSGEMFCTPGEIALAAEFYPELTILMGHMGGVFLVEEAIQAAARRDNIYLETSGALARGVRKAVSKLGAERLVHGSDMPYESERGAAWELQKYNAAELSEQDAAKIKGENAIRILKQVPSYAS